MHVNVSANHSENARDIKITNIATENSHNLLFVAREHQKQLHSAALETGLIPECKVQRDNVIFSTIFCMYNTLTRMLIWYTCSPVSNICPTTALLAVLTSHYKAVPWRGGRKHTKGASVLALQSGLNLDWIESELNPDSI